MLTTQEIEYIKCLLPVYYKYGYKNYVCHTLTNNYEDFDIYLYLSKDSIVSDNKNQFIFTNNSILLKIDSSSRNESNYIPNIDDTTELSIFEGVLNIDVAEFVYTNANTTYSNTKIPLNPDINYMNYDSNNYILIFAFVCVLAIQFLYNFICKILRLRK